MTDLQRLKAERLALMVKLEALTKETSKVTRRLSIINEGIEDLNREIFILNPFLQKFLETK